MKTSLLTVCLAVFSTLAFAQGSQEPPKPAPKGRYDCSQAKDPKACEERHAKMKAAHDQAAKACEGKPNGAERRECMRHEMCNQSPDPKGCEERATKMKAALDQARKSCEGKQGAERRECVREEMHKREK